MRFIAAVILCASPMMASAQEAKQKPSQSDTAIERGLAFLAKDAVAWKKKHNCTSCHHAALVIWSMREAKELGHKIDEPLLAELTKWIAESGDGKFSLKRPAEAPNAASPKAIYFALALGTDPRPDEASVKGMKLLLKTVQSEQTDSGSWSTWPKTRPPIFGSSDETLTLLATLAVLPHAGDDSLKTVRDKAIKWLVETKTDDDAQSVALRLVLWKRLARPEKEYAPLIDRIKKRQNADGGWSQTREMASDSWSQTREMASDSWATGQALYALSHAGVKSDEGSIQRGRAFLIKSQRDDGSWAMTSRPTKPGDKGGDNLIPIIGGGSSWAVLGLVRSR